MRDMTAKWSESNFGLCFDGNIPQDCDMLMVCKQGENQMEFVKFCMPHQLYRKDVQELGDEIYIFPYDSSKGRKIGLGP